MPNIFFATVAKSQYIQQKEVNKLIVKKRLNSIEFFTSGIKVEVDKFKDFFSKKNPIIRKIYSTRK